METNDSSRGRAERTSAQFSTTHWSVVLAAADTESPEAASAIEELCRTYWYPLYAFVRLKGNPPEDAADLTQAFFERFLQRRHVRNFDPQKGRFRTYLLTIREHEPPTPPYRINACTRPPRLFVERYTIRTASANFLARLPGRFLHLLRILRLFAADLLNYQ